MFTLHTSSAIGIPRTRAQCCRDVDLDRLSKGSHKSISNTREALPVAKFALKANALGNLECRDDAPLDLLAGFPGSFRRFAGTSSGPDRGWETNRSLSLAISR
jgi:hypothetical protein